MIVGTHILVQKNVEFRDLGLAIIDEEQRFGVARKGEVQGTVQKCRCAYAFGYSYSENPQYGDERSA